MSTGNFSDEFVDAFAFDDIDPSKIASGGSALPEGYYRLGITEVVRHDDKKGACNVSCEVLEAADPKLVSRSHTEYLAWPDRNKGETYNRIKAETLLAWCLAAGVITEELIAQRKTEHKGFDPAWLDAMVGRQLIGRIDCENYKDVNGGDKQSFKIEKRVWTLTNPKVAGVLPSLPKPSPAGGQQQPPTPPAAPPAAAQSNPPFGDLPV